MTSHNGQGKIPETIHVATDRYIKIHRWETHKQLIEGNPESFKETKIVDYFNKNIISQKLFLENQIEARKLKSN